MTADQEKKLDDALELLNRLNGKTDAIVSLFEALLLDEEEGDQEVLEHAHRMAVEKFRGRGH